MQKTPSTMSPGPSWSTPRQVLLDPRPGPHACLNLGRVCAVSLEASLTCITVICLKAVIPGPVLHASYFAASIRPMQDDTLGCLSVPPYTYKVPQPVLGLCERRYSQVRDVSSVQWVKCFVVECRRRSAGLPSSGQSRCLRACSAEGRLL